MKWFYKKTRYPLIAFILMAFSMPVLRDLPGHAISIPRIKGNLYPFSTNHNLGQLSSTVHIYFPIVIKQPFVTKTHYMHITEPGFDPYTIGQSDAKEHEPIIPGMTRDSTENRLILILDWGQPCKTPSNALGAYSHDDNDSCHVISDLEAKMKDYIGGYCTKMHSIRPGGYGQNCGYCYNSQAVPVILGFGVDNCIGGYECTNPSDSQSNPVTYEHGQAWGALINDLNAFTIDRGYAYQVFIAGAMDIEGAWNTYTNTKAWMDGYKSVTYNTFYNYGNCDCPDGYQPFAPFPRDWSYDRIHYVSWYRGLPVRYPLPQIYHAGPSGIDARRWQGLSKWAVLNGYGKMIFRELLTQYGACSQTQNCSGPGWAIDNTPLFAITQMRDALNADSQTADSLYFYLRSTDINWYPDD